MTRRTSDSPTGSATPDEEPEEWSSCSSWADDRPTIAEVTPHGNRLDALIAIRDRLAAETDDTLWSRHKEECSCVCGMGDGRLLVALVKELRAVLLEIDEMPEARQGSPSDDLAARRAARRAAAAAS